MSRLGIHAAKIETIRDQRGLTPAGFRTDRTDPEATSKEAMLQDLYHRADARLPSGLGYTPPPDPASDPDESEE
ncbi:hypothetical protein ACLGGT_10935 [Roseovarius sp. MS2]|uniref:hypothetical protein n=1 Tax=Roseovarius sp. MS2 TaxID=3390728 RepID=UPI003EDB9503